MRLSLLVEYYTFSRRPLVDNATLHTRRRRPRLRRTLRLIMALGAAAFVAYVADIPSKVFWRTPYGATIQHVIYGGLKVQDKYQHAPRPYLGRRLPPQVARMLTTKADRELGHFYTGDDLRNQETLINRELLASANYQGLDWHLQWVHFGHLWLWWGSATVSAQVRMASTGSPAAVNRLNMSYSLTETNGRWLIARESFDGFVPGYGP